jgi:hypothetical protein
VLQLLPLQPAQDDLLEVGRGAAAPLSPLSPPPPPLLKPQTDITRWTFSDSHLGQLTDSSLLNTNRSNLSQQLQHSYS